MNHYPDKYAPSDMNLQQMLEQASLYYSSTNQDCGIVQLLLLKHLLSSNRALASNMQHIQTLVKIICKNFHHSNGSLALDALYSVLYKNDLCHHIDDLKIWFAFADTENSINGENHQVVVDVQEALTEELVRILEKKDAICEQVRQDINAAALKNVHPNNANVIMTSYNDEKIDEIISKLMDSNFLLNGEEKEDISEAKDTEFHMSPMLLEFIRSKSLAEIAGGHYHSTCVQASVYIQNDPKLFLKIVSSIIPDIISILREEALFSTPILKCPAPSSSSANNKSFHVKLKKQSLICRFKIHSDQKSLSDLEPMLELSDYDWILHQDNRLQDFFQPLEEDDENIEINNLNSLILKATQELPLSKKHCLLLPFSKKILSMTNKNLQKKGGKKMEGNELFEELFEKLPMKIPELLDLIKRSVEVIPSPFSLQMLGLSLTKVAKIDKWELLALPNLQQLANMLEHILMTPNEIKMVSFVRLVKSFTKLVVFNSSFADLITVTHFAMIRDNVMNPDDDVKKTCIELVTKLLEIKLEVFGKKFRKWLVKNLNHMFKLKSPLEIILSKHEFKPEFIETLGNYILVELAKKDKDDDVWKNETAEDILEILVAKHSFQIKDFSVLDPCKALLLQLQNDENIEKCLELMVVPLMKEITKQTRAGGVVDQRKINLFIECLESLEYELFTNTNFKENWPSYVKSSLKYGLKPDVSPFILKAFQVTLENVVISSGGNFDCRFCYWILLIS